MPSLPPSAAGPFDRVARAYRESRLPYPPRMLDWMMRSVAGRKRGVALDVGAGPGTLAIPLARCFRKVVAVDPSRGMLRELAAQSQRQIQRPLPVGARAEALPFRGGVFGFAACSQSLHWMEPAVALPELLRVLAPDGLLMLCWQRHMTAESGPEVVYRAGFEEVVGAVPERPASRPFMEQAGAGLGKPLDRWRREVVATYTPKSLAVSFLSREATAHFDDEVRGRLAAAWERRAGQGLGSRIPYVFTVEAEIFRAAALHAIRSASSA